MTPFMLLDSLKEILEGLMAGIQLKCGRPVKVYTQNAPMRRTEEDDGAFPYCLIKLGDGRDGEEGPVQDIAMVFGVLDESDDYEGFRDAVNLVEAVRQRFYEYPQFGPFEVITKKTAWTFPQDGETYPYYFGAVLLCVALPGIPRVSNFI